MEQFKRVQVIMLPTEDNHSKFAKYILDSSFGGCIKENELCTTTSTIGWSNMFKPQHLYITSDDEIKEGDWFITIRQGYIGKPSKCIKIDAISVISQLENSDNPNHTQYTEFKFAKKIIATTDTSLKIKTYYEIEDNQEINLPQPSQQFIDKYIEEYNKGNIITDVLVEYEKTNIGSIINVSKRNFIEQLKINPKDNTITIKKLKDNWNREEVIGLLKLIKKDTINSIELDIDSDNLICDLNINKWIEENL